MIGQMLSRAVAREYAQAMCGLADLTDEQADEVIAHLNAVVPYSAECALCHLVSSPGGAWCDRAGCPPKKTRDVIRAARAVRYDDTQPSTRT